MKHTSVLSALLLGASVAVTASAFAPTPAQAIDLKFEYKTGTQSPDMAPYLNVDMTDVGNNQVKFRFTNNSLSVITNIGFGKVTGDNDEPFSNYLLSSPYDLNFFPEVIGSGGSATGVRFSESRNNNLPGVFGWSSALTFSADSAPVKKGIEQGEYMDVVLNILSGQTFADVRSGFERGDLSIALHVQQIGTNGEGSAWFQSIQPVPDPGEPVPEPITMFGLGIGLAGGGLLKQKYGKKANKEKVTV